MVVSNTIPLKCKYDKIHVVDISTILGVTIHCIATGHGSLSNDIFDPRRYANLERRLSTQRIISVSSTKHNKVKVL